jgi:dihydroneopterin triphosphate diphosphatase
MEITTRLIEAHVVRIVRNKVEFLLMKRSPNEKYPNIWQMVTGKIKENEKAYETALREIKEETGLEISEIFVVPKVNSFYNEEEDKIVLIPVFVANIDIEKKITLSKEHSKFRWVRRNIANKLLAWPEQKESVNIIVDYFEQKYQNLNFMKINLS